MEFLIALFITLYATQFLYLALHITLDSDMPVAWRTFNTKWDIMKQFIPFVFLRVLFSFDH